MKSRASRVPGINRLLTLLYTEYVQKLAYGKSEANPFQLKLI